MIANAATPPFQRATVRLMPSTASEPFSATYRRNSAGMFTSSHQLSPCCFIPFTRPTPSTWPCTKCPPSGAPAVRGSSRFNRLPSLAFPKDVLCKVSVDRSAQKKSSPVLTAVRQQPFTAMLEPTVSVDGKGAVPAGRMRNWPPASELFRDSIFPRCSMIPVNISKITLHSKIGSESPQCKIFQLGNFSDGPQPVLRHWKRDRPENSRSIEQNHLVHEPCFEHCAVQSAARFENYAQEVTPPELTEYFSQFNMSFAGPDLNDLNAALHKRASLRRLC